MGMPLAIALPVFSIPIVFETVADHLKRFSYLRGGKQLSRCKVLYISV
jgi:hypothetical protein